MNRRRALATALGLVVSSVLALIYVVPPESGLYPSCPIHILTGILCPGCGGTRALHALLHGRLAAALELNPLVTSAAAPVLVFAAIQCHSLWRYGKLRSLHVPRAMQAITAIVVAAFWIARNLAAL